LTCSHAFSKLSEHHSCLGAGVTLELTARDFVVDPPHFILPIAQSSIAPVLRSGSKIDRASWWRRSPQGKYGALSFDIAPQSV